MSGHDSPGERPIVRVDSVSEPQKTRRLEKSAAGKGPDSSPFRARLRQLFRQAVGLSLLVAGMITTAVIAGVVTFSISVKNNEMTVPDLGGASIARASEVLAVQELKLLREGSRFHDTIPSEFIVDQDPPAGSILKKGRSVRVWLSLGPSRRVVPRVEGESLQTAQLILEQAGLAVGRVVEITSDTYAPDTIIAQSPEPYEEAGDETRVSLLLSRGYMANAYVMPDFIGRDYADLLDVLSRGVLRVSEIKYLDFPGAAKNIIVRQSPTAGTKVYGRDRIVLHLSKGSL